MRRCFLTETGVNGEGNNVFDIKGHSNWQPFQHFQSENQENIHNNDDYNDALSVIAKKIIGLLYVFIYVC